MVRLSPQSQWWHSHWLWCRKNLLTRTKPSSSDLCAIYPELEDATPAAYVVMNRWFCPETKLELGDPNACTQYCPSNINIENIKRKITPLIVCLVILLTTYLCYLRVNNVFVRRWWIIDQNIWISLQIKIITITQKLTVKLQLNT